MGHLAPRGPVSWSTGERDRWRGGPGISPSKETRVRAAKGVAWPCPHPGHGNDPIASRGARNEAISCGSHVGQDSRNVCFSPSPLSHVCTHTL